MPSQAFQLFNGRRRREVLEMAGVLEAINVHPGPKTKYSLLNGGLVLLVSSWEVYCEDVAQQAADKIKNRSTIRFVQLATRLQRDVIRYAGESYKPNQDPLTEQLAKLPDGGWRELLVHRLNEYIRDFNTPRFSRSKGKHLNGLF